MIITFILINLVINNNKTKSHTIQKKIITQMYLQQSHFNLK